MFKFLASVLVGLFLVVGCGGDSGDAPRDVTPSNVEGYWYGQLVVDGDPVPVGPVFLHLGGAVPGIDTIEHSFEEIGFQHLVDFGRFRVEEGKLILQNVSGGGGFSEDIEHSVVSLTRDAMTLGYRQGGYSITIELRRGSSCYASAAWFQYGTRLNAGTFDGDGRLHVLQTDGSYAFSVPELCFPYARADITGDAIGVGDDGLVRIATMTNDGIRLAELPADSAMDAVPTVTMLGDAETSSTYVYPHIRIAKTGGTTVVLFQKGATLYSWHKAGGAWVQSETTLPNSGTLTPTAIETIDGPDGSLYVRTLSSDMAARFEDGAWSSVATPTHPELGAPGPLVFDADGRAHGAWRERRSTSFDFWDHLIVGKQNADGTWTTAYAGMGDPWHMRVSADGSYDLVGIVSRVSDAIGLYHIDALEPASWSVDYGHDRVSFVAGAQLSYVATLATADILKMPWAAFSPDGAVLVGGGGAGVGPPAFGLVRNPSREEQPRTRDTNLIIEFDAEVPATVSFPSLGESCSESCEIAATSRALIPMRIETDGVATATVSTFIGLGTDLLAQLPDGTYVLGIEPDLAGTSPREVKLKLKTTRVVAEVVEVLEPEDETSRPALASALAGGGGVSYVVREVGSGFALDARDPDGASLASTDGFTTPTLLQATADGVVLVARFGADRVAVWYDDALVEQERVVLGNVTAGELLAAREDGTLLRFVRSTDGTATDLHLITSAGGDTTVTIPLTGLEEVRALSNGAAVRIYTGGRSMTVDGEPIPSDHHVVVLVTDEGEIIEHYACSSNACRVMKVATFGNEAALFIEQIQFQAWTSGSPLASLPQPTAAAKQHIVRLAGTTGTVTSTVTAEGLYAPFDGTFIASPEGVLYATSGPYNVGLAAITYDGEITTRTYSSRLGGECVGSPCVDRAAYVGWLPGGEVAVYFEHGDRPLTVERFTLDASLPPVAYRTAYIRWNPFNL